MFEERGGDSSGGTWVDLAKRLKEGPDSLDWVSEGKTMQPLEQGNCASCWAMATVRCTNFCNSIRTNTAIRSHNAVKESMKSEN